MYAVAAALLPFGGAEGEVRTHTTLRSAVFKTAASAGSATSASGHRSRASVDHAVQRNRDAGHRRSKDHEEDAGGRRDGKDQALDERAPHEADDEKVERE